MKARKSEKPPCLFVGHPFNFFTSTHQYLSYDVLHVHNILQVNQIFDFFQKNLFLFKMTIKVTFILRKIALNQYFGHPVNFSKNIDEFENYRLT